MVSPKILDMEQPEFACEKEVKCFAEVSLDSASVFLMRFKSLTWIAPSREIPREGTGFAPDTRFAGGR